MSTHTAPTNAEIARLRELGRRRRSRSEAGRFLVEGPKLVSEALRSQLVVEDIIAAEGWQSPDYLVDHAADRGVAIRTAPTSAIDRVATTTSPQLVVAEVQLPSTGWDSLAAQQTDHGLSVIVVVDLNDPGNLGTIARSAVAAGFDAVVALGDTTDPFGPKAVRAAAGAMFHTRVVTDRSVRDGMQHLAALGLRRVGTRMEQAVACDRTDLTTPLALVLGNEAHGLAPTIDALIDDWVSVPMPGPAESLNVAMTATILSYEVARQRRGSPSHQA